MPARSPATAAAGARRSRGSVPSASLALRWHARHRRIRPASGARPRLSTLIVEAVALFVALRIGLSLLGAFMATQDVPVAVPLRGGARRLADHARAAAGRPRVRARRCLGALGRVLVHEDRDLRLRARRALRRLLPALPGRRPAGRHAHDPPLPRGGARRFRASPSSPRSPACCGWSPTATAGRSPAAPRSCSRSSPPRSSCSRRSPRPSSWPPRSGRWCLPASDAGSWPRPAPRWPRSPAPGRCCSPFRSRGRPSSPLRRDRPAVATRRRSAGGQARWRCWRRSPRSSATDWPRAGADRRDARRRAVAVGRHPVPPAVGGRRRQRRLDRRAR